MKTKPVEFWNAFWRNVSHVGEKDSCWPWIGKVHPFGYGRVAYLGHRFYAHRVAWESRRGPVPDKMCVCHSCDNPVCCNPSHLWLGTPVDNHRDMTAKKRNQRGEKHHGHKLTAKAVKEIRELYRPRPTMRELALKYGVDAATIANVVKGKIWRHI